MLKKILKYQTRYNYCKICFKKIKYSFFNILNPYRNICNHCLNELNPRFQKIQIGSIKGIGIYPYQGLIKELLFQFKGCYDFELKDIFLEPYRLLLSLRYKNWIFVPVPSHQSADQKRGFNHVKEIIKSIGFNYYDCLIKTDNMKQSSLSYYQRKETYCYFNLKHKKNLNNKNVIIIDDVITTGETMKTCINLIKKLKPKKIKFLTISYSSRFESKFDERK